ncbi:hypothetical protein MVEN_00344600 [Mycena venus]|uniref:Uncharacterized protein n=1 Tax=Mycena venus TaxID=2733690 RepID=A0A8H6YTT9_9AGAR|nr:hypothetical protein MVEN_00344600 [Mycena venus]
MAAEGTYLYHLPIKEEHEPPRSSTQNVHHPYTQLAPPLPSPRIIPNHTFRYVTLGILGGLALLCTLRLKAPSTQLRRLSHSIEQTDDLICRTMTEFPRDYLKLTQETRQLLNVKMKASLIKCRLLDSELSWKKCRVLSREIAACTKRVGSIRTEVELTVEAERQRSLESAIVETDLILATASTQSVPKHNVNANILYH